jgi:hypothetical protein
VGRPWLLGLLLALVTARIVAALADSEVSGTGAENVGESGPERAATPSRAPAAADHACDSQKRGLLSSKRGSPSSGIGSQPAA